MSNPYPNCLECKKDQEAMKRYDEEHGPIFIYGDKRSGKLGPISRMLMEEEMLKYKRDFEARHGHPYPDDFFFHIDTAEVESCNPFGVKF